MTTNTAFATSRPQKPMIMGILNATPDSFSDGGKYGCVDVALSHVGRMLEEGAEIIDIGGESTRPGSDPISAATQIERVLPIILAIRKQFGDICLSIDTTSHKVANVALNEGATIINDVSAGQDEPLIMSLAAEHNVEIILMHSQNKPKTMQDKPYYDDVVNEVIAFLETRIQAAKACGIRQDKIIIDPGIGFGKRRQDNLQLLANLDRIVALGYPVLLGTSRKRFMGSLLNITDTSELVTATAVTTSLGVMAGVSYFRVHDILANAQAAKLTWAIKNS